MAKIKTQYVCQSCGTSYGKWVGKCSACNEWNTIVEEVVNPVSKKNLPLASSASSDSKPITLSKVTCSKVDRIDVNNGEFNRLLGGGLVPGSLVLIGGEPGIGKSTLILQIALSVRDLKVLYVSGEESLQQIKMRAERLGLNNDNCYFLSETSIENIVAQAQNLEPDILVVDSIQTVNTDRVESSSGSVSQIRECTNQLMHYAKHTATSVLLIGHINKDGAIAGPKVLEHMVDVVFQFEGDTLHFYRVMRSVKNRFGSTSELGIYEMRDKGLREVTNPSELLVSSEHTGLSGTAISASVEGARPFLIEVQSLVSTAVYGTPQRSVTGFDLRRLNMMLAVLEKRAGFKLGSKDVFINLAGGIKIADPAIDLSVIVAILSSNFDKAINPTDCFAGEVGLTGEVRPINRLEQRIAEAQKLGMSRIFVPKFRSGSDVKLAKGIEIVEIANVGDCFKRLFR
ncbi:MAG: DNA repair protein RadA [Bacteroidales bacterium]